MSQSPFNICDINPHNELHQLLNSSILIGFNLPDLIFSEVLPEDSITSFTIDSFTSLKL